MNDLDDIYRHLAIPRSQEELADGYSAAEQHGASVASGRGPASARPIPVLAMAVPPSATVNTAIYTLHALPKDIEGALPEHLLEIAHRKVALALHLCQQALESDGSTHHYAIAEWLPTVYDTAGSLLQSARLDTEPPTLVQATQEAISWLSRAIAELDEASEEAPTSLAETLARLLAVWTFTNVALPSAEPG